MKILVVGAGSIGRRHLGNLKALGQHDLLLVDPDRARAEMVASEVGAAVFVDIESALAARPTIALIASPTHLHLEQSLVAARAGCHLFIEKPLGASVAGAERLADEVARRKLHVMVGCNTRFDPVYVRIKQALDRRELGRVYSSQIYFGYDLSAWRPNVDYRKVYSARRAQGGGILLDAIHEVDLARWWFGEPRRLLSLPRHTGALETDAEDVADVLVEFRSGVVAHLHLNCRDPVYRRTVSMAGDAAVLEANFAARTLAIRRRDQPPERYDFNDSDRNTMYIAELRHFLAVVDGTERPSTSLAEAIANLELSLDARDRGPIVSIPRRSPHLERLPVVIQARMGASRLPGKVLKTAAGQTMLAHLVERLRRARLVDRIIVATTDRPADRAIIDEAERLGLSWFAGSEQDVLSRYVGAARQYDLPAVVRITADCPLMDPDTVDAAIALFLRERPDYCSNVHPRSVPDGFDVEVISRDALERADREATEPADREHVTHFVYTHPERFEILSVAPLQRALARRRWTLDTEADYTFLRTVFEQLHPATPDFRLADILALLTRHPELDTVPWYDV